MAETRAVAAPARVKDKEREELLERLRAEHGAIDTIDVPDGRVIVVAATNDQMEAGRYFNALANPASDRYSAALAFAQVCAVYPDRSELKAIFKRWVGLPPVVSGKGWRLCNGDSEELLGN